MEFLAIVLALAVIYFLFKAIGYAPGLFEVFGKLRKDTSKSEMTRNIATFLWIIAGIWYAIAILIVFFTGIWIIASVLTGARDWWHSPNR